MLMGMVHKEGRTDARERKGNWSRKFSEVERVIVQGLAFHRQFTQHNWEIRVGLIDTYKYGGGVGG